MPKRYLDEFKRDVVAFARSSNLSQREVARYFGISTQLVQRWVKQAEIADVVVGADVVVDVGSQALRTTTRSRSSRALGA